MFFYTLLTAITVTLAFAVKTQYGRQTMIQTRQMAADRTMLTVIFMILALVSAGRYYVGNDYGEYVEIFHKISLQRSVSSESGFNSIVRLIQMLCGEDRFIPIFAVFSFATVAFFLKAVREQSDWFGYGFFLFMASGYYLSSLNTLRYYFALAIAVYSVKHLLKGEHLSFIFWILFASLFHKTVLVVMPVYLFASRPWKKWDWSLIGLGCLSLVLFRGLFRKLIFAIYPYYENSVFDTGETSYLNIVKGISILLFSIYFYKKSIAPRKDNIFYFQLNIAAVLLYLFASFIPEVSRIAYYFNFYQIFLIANILASIEPERKRLKTGLALTIGAAYCVYFAIFMIRAADISLRIVPYTTWIFG